mmetsp:Transcript_45271/g.141913  ORF Transcript_45271/g.141913 Transcript_45271/m.141913 type:complete len:207 (-) Transcript_45271:675-1295(-)
MSSMEPSVCRSFFFAACAAASRAGTRWRRMRSVGSARSSRFALRECPTASKMAVASAAALSSTVSIEPGCWGRKAVMSTTASWMLMKHVASVSAPASTQSRQLSSQMKYASRARRRRMLFARNVSSWSRCSTPSPPPAASCSPSRATAWAKKGDAAASLHRSRQSAAQTSPASTTSRTPRLVPLAAMQPSMPAKRRTCTAASGGSA